MAVRLWIGEEAGNSAMKIRTASPELPRGHTEAPACVDGAGLWLESEATDGTRTSASVPLD